MFGNTKKPAKAIVVRKVTVSRPVDQPANGNAQRRPLPSSGNGSSRNGVAAGKRTTAGANGYLSVASRQDSKTPGSTPSRSISPSRRSSRTLKRKTQSPSTAPDFASSSGDDDNEGSSDAEGPGKRPKLSPVGGTLDPDMKRVLLDENAMKKDQQEGADAPPIIEGSDLTVGKFKEYNTYFSRTGEEDGEAAVAELQYPSRCAREQFQLVLPSDKSDYNPIEDIVETIHHTCQNYFPETQANFLTDEITGYPRRFRRAAKELSGPAFLEALDDYNKFITTSLDDGTISNHVRSRHNVPLLLVERILDQIYSRTVSPHLKLLRKYDNGTDDVYGELKPRFIDQIFVDTSLRSDQVFVDLGSGVGNVVLQAALQIGCEAWGVERMDNPANLAAKQVEEFEPRCKRWALNVGKARVLHGDFMETPRINEVLRRADVILVNNQAFTPKSNLDLTYKFLDLKDGCKIVSLKSFLPENWQMRERNLQDPRNILLENVRKEYFSDSVSWTGVGGTYYMAVKNAKTVDNYLKKLQKADKKAKAKKTLTTTETKGTT